MNDSTNEKRARATARPRRLGRGYLVAVGGIAVFVVAVVVGATLDVNGAAGGVLALGAFMVMAAAFVAGTVLVAVDKGYGVVVGVLLGVFAPLGLMIVTLLPAVDTTPR